jgi:hypothetical protein
VRLFILPHTIMGVFLLLLIPVRLYVHYWGTPVTATIDTFEARPSKKGGDYYYIHYHYVLNGRRHEGTETRNLRPAVGQTFAGRAAELNGHATIDPPTLRAGDILPLVGIAIFWNGVLWAFLYIAWVAPIRQRRLARYGEATGGVVTGKQARRGKGTTYSVSYEFEVDGHKLRGKFDVTSAAYGRAHQGMPITVLFDPSRPKRSLPHELSDFLVSGVSESGLVQV